METLTLTKPAELVPVLPWELVVEILSWLPVKTLMQLKCVSKSWKSLISNDKAFEKLHLQKRSPQNKHVLLTSLKDTGRFYCSCPGDECYNWLIPCPVRRLIEDPSPVFDDEDACGSLKAKYDVVGSCNGLMCFHAFSDYHNGPCSKSKVRVWIKNPATRLRSRKSPALYTDNCMKFGFGYDDLGDTYKVVALSHKYQEQNLKTMVYCMGDSSWRKISSDLGFRLNSISSSSGEFVGGCLNWLATDMGNHHNHVPDSDTILMQMVIISFDLHKEVYWTLSLPEGTSEVRQKGPQVYCPQIGLGVLGNCLCLFQEHIETHFDMWQMREYGVRESWTRLMRVSYEHLQFDVFRLQLPLMCLSEDGDILMLYQNQNWEAIVYNLRDNSVKHVQPRSNKHWSNAGSYVPSLVSPY